MTTIAWNISQMDTKPTEGSYTDVVITAHWNCSGVDGDYTGYAYGSCSFAAPSAPFTPYADLTQDQVLGWVWASGVDKDATEANVESQIDLKKNPPVVVLPLPWAQLAV